MIARSRLASCRQKEQRNMKNLKQKISLLLAAILAASPGVAFAEGQPPHGAPPASMSRTGRAFTYVIPQLRTQTSPASATCTITTGTVTAAMTWYPGASSAPTADGFVFVSDPITSLEAVGGGIAYSSALFSAIGQPSRLMVDFYDASANGTLVCSSLTLVGHDWSGRRRTETLTSLAETTTTPRYTANAYSDLIGIQLLGCSGMATGDLLRIRVSPWISLPVKINASSDIDAVCVNQTALASAGQATSRLCLKGSDFTFDLGSNTIYALNDRFQSYLGTESTSTCQTDRSTMTIRGRASPYEKSF